jgi:hypothetical protein
MDATITYNDLAALAGVNIPSSKPRPNFERIRVLRRHLKRALQQLSCPQSTQLGWKGLVMSRAMYALHTSQPFCIPTNLGAAAGYTNSVVAGQPRDLTPLMQSKQMSIDMKFNCRMHYFLLMQNIKQACFNMLDSSINYAFKVWNKPAMQGGMPA